VIHPPEVANFRAMCHRKEGPQPTKGITLHDTKPYLTRNRDIVQASSILVAAPKSDEIVRSGTWSTVRYARQCDRTIYILLPYRIVVENDRLNYEPTWSFISPWDRS
jgi:hypothetical protein